MFEAYEVCRDSSDMSSALGLQLQFVISSTIASCSLWMGAPKLPVKENVFMNLPDVLRTSLSNALRLRKRRAVKTIWNLYNEISATSMVMKWALSTHFATRGQRNNHWAGCEVSELSIRTARIVSPASVHYCLYQSVNIDLNKVQFPNMIVPQKTSPYNTESNTHHIWRQ